jgi:hypothetical protein
MFVERRRNRSTETQKALELQLEASAERAGFCSLVLVEEQGLVVAGAGERALFEEIAAISPQVARARELWHGTVPTEAGDQLLTIAAVRSASGPLWLSGVGGKRSAIVAELGRSGQGVCRILA